MKKNNYIVLTLCVIIIYIIFGFSNITIDQIRQGIPIKEVLFSHTEQDPLDDQRVSIYRERRQLVAHGCENINKTVYDSMSVRNNIKIDPVHNIRYCPIPKVGTTFWVRALTVLSSKGRLKSPFEIGRGQADLLYWTDLSEDERSIYANRGQSFMFVRDPYARLFSGYENKMYLVNPSFWKGYGGDIVRTMRGHDATYGFDVTFTEFIQYILQLSENQNAINVHFRPMHQLCDPCQISYDYIGYLETFSDDAHYLLTKWRNDFNDFTLRFDDFEKEAAVDTARTTVKHLFSARRILLEDEFPFIKLMLRTWRDLQIRGYLSKSIEFPFTGDVSDVTYDMYMGAVVKALGQPQNRTAVKLQRNEALVQAYRQVPLDVMERLHQFVYWDCVLFGYNDRPTELFDRSTPNYVDFLYLDGLS